MKLTKDQAQEKVFAVLADHTGLQASGIAPHFRFDGPELKFDSIDHVEFVMMIEDEFDIDIPDDECEGLHTVEDIVNIVIRKVG